MAANVAQETEKVQDGHSNTPEHSDEKTEHDAPDAADGTRTNPGKQDSSPNSQSDKPKGPSGGFDSTPIPKRPAGYTIKITVHRASNLPMADLHGFSSDPYCLSQISTDTPKRHKEDPQLRWRTQTVRKSIEPTWDDDWVIANVPATGFKLKIRVYDEDPTDRDDLLGRVHITVPSLHDGWEGIDNAEYKLLARGGSYRAYLLQAVTTCFRKDKHFRGLLYVSIELLGRTPEDGQDGRLYSAGPCRWIRHYSPMLGRLTNIKEPSADDSQHSQQPRQGGKQQQKKVEHYNFQANQMQLQGPVPAELYHRFVEFKPWVGRMFTSSGLSGVLMGKALHHQHTRVYNFARSTNWGFFPDGPSEEMTKQFLELVHWDQGGRIFTYVLTLDALWRFTETGKEFGIDMLSKHTMHSDVSIYIAFSGEFFVRRLKHPRRPSPPDAPEDSSQEASPEHKKNEEHPPQDLGDGDDPPKHPNHYELVIDNDSGTYRPNADLLPVLKRYLSHQLPGLHILTLDCNKDAEQQQRMKKEQRERKKTEGDHIVYTQGSRSSSLSSSDISELDAIQAALANDDAAAHGHEHAPRKQIVQDSKLMNRAKVQKAKRTYMMNKRDGEEGSSGRALNECAPGGSSA